MCLIQLILQNRKNQDMIMHERVNATRSINNLVAKNYDVHYEKLLNIMHSQRKITLNKPTHPKKKFVRSQIHLNTNTSPRLNYDEKTHLSIENLTQKTKRVFDKSLFARSLFPNQHYFHITKSNKFFAQKDSSLKKMSQFKFKNQGKIVKLMVIVRFLDTKTYCKNSNFAVQIQPYELRSPILSHSQLSKDAIGFKFKHRQNEDFFVSIFQIRGNNEHLIMKSNKLQDFHKYKLDVQTKVANKTKKIRPVSPQIINKNSEIQEQQSKKFQLSTRCRISIQATEKHQNIYSFSKSRQKSHADKTCTKDTFFQIQKEKKRQMTRTNFFSDKNKNLFIQKQGQNNIVLMKLD